MTDQPLAGKKIALLATNGFEDAELTKPLEAVTAAGAEVTIISDIESFEGENGTPMTADMLIDGVLADDYDGLLLPGGVKNPDTMRQNPTAVSFVRSFKDAHKPIAAICHAPWLLIEAGIVQGRKLASWPSLKTDISNAGGTWVDEQVVVDDNLITSRNPDDIPAFSDSAVKAFAGAV